MAVKVLPDRSRMAYLYKIDFYRNSIKSYPKAIKDSLILFGVNSEG
jgi:hypothetical protein